MSKDDKASKKARRRHLLACCVALGVLVILGVLALIFYLVYRPRPPRVVATPVDVSVDEFSLLPHPVLKLSVGVHVVVSNPSHSPFRYGVTLSPVTYHGAVVGETLVPAGEVGGKSTALIEPATVVDGVKLVESPHFAADVVAGVLPFVATARVVGNALVLRRTFQVPVSVEVVCYVNLYVFHGESSSRCVATIRVGPGAASGSGSGSGSGAGYPTAGRVQEHD